MNTYQKKYDYFIATCASGLEVLLNDELASLGIESIKKMHGAVLFSGPLRNAYLACLWSRLASRILKPLATFSAADKDALYAGADTVEWDDHLSPETTFSVRCTSRESAINNSRYAALRVKDALVDQFRARYDIRPSVQTERPDIALHLFLDHDIATLSIDMSGDGLHKRGYRKSGGQAPLKENLAAALMLLSGWSKNFSSDHMLLDPMCGSGTLLIEAALIYGGIAPGLFRDYFGFTRWKGHALHTWEKLLSDAKELKVVAKSIKWPRIHGFDADLKAIRSSLENITAAGLDGIIHVERQELGMLSSHLSKIKGDAGLIVVNPPYGERMGSQRPLNYLYECLGEKLRRRFKGWNAGIFTSGKGLEKSLGMNPVSRHMLYNGPIECHLNLFDIPVSTEPRSTSSTLLDSHDPGLDKSEAFGNRLLKNLKSLSKWIKKESVSCYRIYDADIPEYNVAIDIYEGDIHIQEYSAPETVDTAKALARLDHIIITVMKIMQVDRKEIFIKVKSRQKGKSQYQKHGSRDRLTEVNEYGCLFLVNLSDYLDTGLFLENRNIRKMIQANSHGIRFLNLFSYTGSATVHAAAGGAKRSTSVDLSPRYLEWASCNLALNGFSEANHRMVQADCMEWLSRTKEQFDIIYLDPPTFSNTKRRAQTFDVQRDHVELIALAAKRLEHDGVLIFSNNFKRFKLDQKALTEFHVRDVGKKTLPPDFIRKSRAHHCWEIRRNQPKGKTT